MNEHFYNGFIKRAQDYGLTVVDAIKLAEIVNFTPPQKAQAGLIQEDTNPDFDPTGLVAPAIAGGTAKAVGKSAIRGLGVYGLAHDAVDSLHYLGKGDYPSAAARAGGAALYTVPGVGPYLGSVASPFINKYIEKKHNAFLNTWPHPPGFGNIGDIPESTNPNAGGSAKLPITPAAFPHKRVKGGITQGVGGFAGNKPRPAPTQPIPNQTTTQSTTPTVNPPRLANSGGPRLTVPNVGKK
jgi:hypothetical protein